MVVRKPKYPADEFARRGKDIYEKAIRPNLRGNSTGRIVAIDIESGDFAIADDSVIASQALITKNPEAQIWCLRIGHLATDKFGSGDTREHR